MPAHPADLSAAAKTRYFLSNIALRGVIAGALALPYPVRVRTMGWIVSRIVAPIAGLRRRIRENLALVCPDLPHAEVERLCRAVPNNAGRTLIEIYSGEDFARRARAAPISGSGLAAFERARAEGRPVFVVTGHIGNYDVIRGNLIPKGHHMGALYRRMANPYFNAHYVRSMLANGSPLFEQGRRGMLEMVRHIKGGGIVAIMTDLHVHGGAELDFFGKPAFTSTVTAELALRYNALMVPIYVIRQPNGLDFELVVLDPIPEGTPEEMTQAVNDGLEALVRQHMDQWFWIHRRWKRWLGKPEAE